MLVYKKVVQIIPTLFIIPSIQFFCLKNLIEKWPIYTYNRDILYLFYNSLTRLDIKIYININYVRRRP